MKKMFNMKFSLIENSSSDVFLPTIETTNNQSNFYQIKKLIKVCGKMDFRIVFLSIEISLAHNDIFVVNLRLGSQDHSCPFRFRNYTHVSPSIQCYVIGTVYVMINTHEQQIPVTLG